MATIAYRAIKIGCGIVMPDDRTNHDTIATTATTTMIAIARETRSMLTDPRGDEGEPRTPDHPAPPLNDRGLDELESFVLCLQPRNANDHHDFIHAEGERKDAEHDNEFFNAQDAPPGV